MPAFLAECRIDGLSGKNIKYPTIAQENGTQGRVIIQFVVERDGTISDVRVDVV